MPDFDPIEQELFAQLGEPPAGQHPSLGLLLACQERALPEELDAHVRKHLGSCRLCTLLLQDYSEVPETSLRQAAEERILATLPVAQGKPVKPRHIWRNSLAGAVAAVLILTASVVLYRKGQSSTSTHVASTKPTILQPANIAELNIPLAPLAPPQDSLLSLQTRGAGTQEPSIESLISAFDAYNKKDYSSAGRHFAALLTAYPRSAVVPLYLGVSRLELRENDSAYAALTLAKRNALSATRNDAEWYLTIAAQRLGRPETRQLLIEVCKDNASRYSAESCRLAATLS